MDAFLNTADTKTLITLGIIGSMEPILEGTSALASRTSRTRSWFVILLVVSTFGILEIIYLFFILKMKPNEFLNSSNASHTSAVDEDKAKANKNLHKCKSTRMERRG